MIAVGDQQRLIECAHAWGSSFLNNDRSGAGMTQQDAVGECYHTAVEAVKKVQAAEVME